MIFLKIIALKSIQQRKSVALCHFEIRNSPINFSIHLDRREKSVFPDFSDRTEKTDGHQRAFFGYRLQGVGSL
jgi:hypothetical protein